MYKLISILYSIADAIREKKNSENGESNEEGGSNEQNVDNGLYGADAILVSFFHTDSQTTEYVIYDNINDLINDLIYGRKIDENAYGTSVLFLYKDKIEDNDLVGKASAGVIHLSTNLGLDGYTSSEYITDLRVKFLNTNIAGNYICVIDPYYNVDDYYIIRRKTDDD